MEHKNKIKIKFITQQKAQWKMPMYACLASLTNLKEIFPTKPMNWDEISNYIFLFLVVNI
jgi:hypothetical protein